MSFFRKKYNYLRIRKNGKALSLTALLCIAFSVLAYDFTLTESEFNSWSLKCKALYLSTHIGQRSNFRNRVPASIIKKERLAADKSKSGAWHYCAGLIYIKRAKLEVLDKEKQSFLYSKAIAEVNFTYSDIYRTDPWFAEIGVTYGNLLTEVGNYQLAQEVFQEVGQHYPNYQQLYLAQSLMLWKQKKLSAAIKLLKSRGEDNISRSIEMSYMVSFLYAESGDIEQAEKYAKIAYGLGYPLPGLKNKIEKLKESN